MGIFDESEVTVEVPYPFIRDVFTEYEDEEDGYSTREVPCWKPGIQDAYVPPDDSIAVAHGEGFMILTIVSRHKPGRYPERVFFTRQWRDPDGKEFGKTNLRMTTVQAFRRLTKGYRHPYILEGQNEAKE